MFNKFYFAVSACLKAGVWVVACFILFVLAGCNTSKQFSSSSTIHALRLKPGQLLKESIQQYVNEQHIQAGWVATCVGSLTHYELRMANQPHTSSDSGHFEIVGFGGTVSENGSHLHISLSDSTGKTIGGHLANNCRVYTTAEIIIVQSNKHVFSREKDGTTPWEELQIKQVQ